MRNLFRISIGTIGLCCLATGAIALELDCYGKGFRERGLLDQGFSSSADVSLDRATNDASVSFWAGTAVGAFEETDSMYMGWMSLKRQDDVWVTLHRDTGTILVTMPEDIRDRHNSPVAVLFTGECNPKKRKF